MLDHAKCYQLTKLAGTLLRLSLKHTHEHRCSNLLIQLGEEVIF